MTIVDEIVNAVRESLAAITAIPPYKESRWSARVRPPWPSTVSVSTLAYVAVQEISRDTAICALGVGAQYDRPSSAAMQAGTALHNALLPIVAQRLKTHTPVVEFRFTERGMTGRVDLLLPRQAVLELKTTTPRSGAGFSPYHKVQAALYHVALKLPVVVVTVSTDPRAVLGTEIVRDSNPANAALELLAAYQQVQPRRPTPPIGECGKCLFSETCGAKNTQLCPTCLRPFTEGLAWVGDFGVHTCGQAFGRDNKGVYPICARGGKVVRKK